MKHECKWKIGLAFWEDEPKKPIPWAQCRHKNCKKMMNANEIESRLNEYEKLKADLEFVTEAGEANNIEIVRLNEVIENYRKATEALSAEDARALSYSLPGFEDNVLWHYANILEGK